MRRVQIQLEEELDRAAAAEAARRGISKAALIRASLAKELGAPPHPDPQAAWAAMTGWLEDGGVDEIDDEVYGAGRKAPGPWGSSIRASGSASTTGWTADMSRLRLWRRRKAGDGPHSDHVVGEAWTLTRRGAAVGFLDCRGALPNLEVAFTDEALGGRGMGLAATAGRAGVLLRRCHQLRHDAPP
jgi:hypothetical protein